MNRTVGRLHVITDAAMQDRFTHVQIAECAIAGGADVIQFRDKTMPVAELIRTATAIRRLCQRAGVMFIVNDRVDVAMAARADGVHVGGDDLPVAIAKRLLGPSRIVGATAPTVEAARRAEDAGAAYLGVGHVFETRSKLKTTLPIGVTGAGRVAEATSIPVIAIGGITLDNAKLPLAAGAWGVAVIGAVNGADDPEAATRKLRQLIDERDLS